MSNYIRAKNHEGLYKVYGIIRQFGEDYFLLWVDDRWTYIRVIDCIPETNYP